MFPELIDKLYRRRDLTAAETEAAMAEVMAGRATAAQIAGLLVALAMKGERAGEIAGFARTMRRHAVPLARPRPDAFDTCGTGGDRSHTVNASSLAALVLAGCGVVVAKHGNRSVSSRCGSADLFEALGVQVAAPPAAVDRALDEAGIAFLFAPTFHPSMRHAGPARRELGVRTVFNLLGPLTNPAGVRRQIVGVARPELTDLLARVLGDLGSTRAWVVHGAGGVDEISTSGATKVSELREGRVRTFTVQPADFGLPTADPAALRVADIAESAAAARAVLGGARGPARDFVLANAAAGLVAAERADDLREGVALGAEALDRGRAAAALEAMARCSTAPAPEGGGAEAGGAPGDSAQEGSGRGDSGPGGKS